MGSLDLECGVGCGSLAVSNDGKDESICVTKTTEGSCSSQSNSAADSSNQGQNSDSEIDQVSHSRRVSSVVAMDCVVDIDQKGVDEVRISVEITMERECRICMLSLDSESGSAIELGCSCKNELAAVHQQCAETWFRSKGNKICEICKSIAGNVVVPNNTKPRQQIFEEHRFLTNAVSLSVFERNTFSTNPISESTLGRNAPSTIAASVQEFELSRSSRNASARRESTAECWVFLVCDIFLKCFFFGFIAYVIVIFILHVF